jgi:hypothetical protein
VQNLQLCLPQVLQLLLHAGTWHRLWGTAMSEKFGSCVVLGAGQQPHARFAAPHMHACHTADAPVAAPTFRLVLALQLIVARQAAAL